MKVSKRMSKAQFKGQGAHTALSSHRPNKNAFSE